MRSPRDRARDVLRQYRHLRFYKENAVYQSKFDFSELEFIEDLMLPESKLDTTLRSIQAGIARTEAFVSHIDRMLKAYHAECSRGDEMDQRRWQILELAYLGEVRHHPSQIAEIVHLSDRQVYNHLGRALDDLAALLFGVDGIDER